MQAKLYAFNGSTNWIYQRIAAFHHAFREASLKVERGVCILWKNYFIKNLSINTYPTVFNSDFLQNKYEMRLVVDYFIKMPTLFSLNTDK